MSRRAKLQRRLKHLREMRVDRGCPPAEAANAAQRAAEIEAELTQPIDDDEIFLARRKAVWLAEARKRIPVGTRVKVVRSDTPEYVGAHGVIVGHDVGRKGEWPMVEVEFDETISVKRGRWTDADKRSYFWCDGAPDDEIEPLSLGLHGRHG